MTGEFYPQIFLEALHTATIVPLGHEPTLYAMKAFGTYPMALPLLMAFAGAMVGHLINYGIGLWLSSLRAKKKTSLSAARYQNVKTHFSNFGFLLLLFCAFPLCNLITLAAGFLQLSPKKAAPMIAAGIALRYGVSFF
jgi:membrane protein YqaA with SNARE-associated domain